MANNYLEFSETYVMTADQASFVDQMLNYLNVLSDQAYFIPMSEDALEHELEIIQSPDDPYPSFRFAGPAAVAALLYASEMDTYPDFVLRTEDFADGEKTYVHIYTEESGTPETVVALLRAMMRQFGVEDSFSLEWAYTCSKPRSGEFGGGAVVWTWNEERWLNTGTWIDQQRRIFAARPRLRLDGSWDASGTLHTLGEARDRLEEALRALADQMDFVAREGL